MQGLEKFREYMSGFRSHYVEIGGLATVLTLEDRGCQHEPPRMLT